MKNVIIDNGGDKWFVREAECMDAALYAIAMSNVTGSVGSKHVTHDANGERVTADVVRLNDDGTERQPYSA